MDCIGWLSPQGELIKCNEHGHLDTAAHLAKRLGINSSQMNADEALRNCGWVRISKMIYGDCGISFFHPRFLTEPQKDFLRDIYFSDVNISRQGMETLKYFDIVEE